MSEQSQLPLGKLLQQAGLISAEQLERALVIQAEYTKMKIGEILVLQQGIKVKTIDFFADKWQEVIEQGKFFPIGYYLQKAALLDEQQIEIILQEQKVNYEKFGVLAIKKGWLKQETIDFFLKNLSSQPPQRMSLSMLEEYDQATLRLDKKYADSSLMLSRILAWTGGIPTLTKTIGQVFAKSDLNIPPGRELNAVDQFVEGTLIRKWQTSKSAASIRSIASSLLNNFRCDPQILLEEYMDILLLENKEYQGNQQQEELLLLGLIAKENNQLKVSNIIYQQIFNQEFVANELGKMILKSNKSPELIESNPLNPIPSVDSNLIIEYTPQALVEKVTSLVPSLTQSNDQIKADSLPTTVTNESVSVQPSSTPEPLTKIVSLIACGAIALLIPLFLTINNYYSSLSKTPKETINSARKISELEQFCNELNFADLNSSLNLISKLETEQQQYGNDFPTNCDNTLNQLRVAIAPQLGKENRILEAIRHLCKVPANSEVHIDAEIWLKRWYYSSNWGEETKFYLEELSEHNYKSCPAAYFDKNEPLEKQRQ